MKGQSICIKCGKEFKWKRGTTQYAKSGVPKWCSPLCRRLPYEKKFEFSGKTEGVSKCIHCLKEFSWQRSQPQLESRGQPKYCSRSCVAKATHRTKVFYWEGLDDEQKMDRLKKYFEKNVLKKDGCWDWRTESKGNIGGYLQMNFDRRNILIHRASWMLYRGKIPEGLCVLHKCDNPRCSNPDHLFLGTNKDNAKDRENKNRGQKGVTHHKCKLSEDNVREIKRLLREGQSCEKISRTFGVTNGTIWFIKNNITWTHIN